MSRIYINGRFLTQDTTGVQRFAREIVRAVDALASGDGSGGRRSLVLLTPPGTSPPPGLRAIESRSVGRLHGQAWEQLELPRHTRDGVSLNLCNTAPLAGHATVVAIHDAGVFAGPQAYSRPFRTWYRLLHPQLGRRALRMVTVSEFSRAELSRYLGIPGDRLTVIPNGGEHILREPADTGILSRLGLSGRYVLAVSSHSAHKNFAGVQAAVKHMRSRDFTLVFAGGTNSRIFNAAGGAAGESMVTGRVTDAELRALYENAECFVYPSFYEGFGLPPLEAMSCGAPVIASDVPSLSEAVGNAAFLVPPTGVEKLAQGLVEMLSNEERRAHFSRAGLEWASRFTWEKTAASTLEVYTEVFNKQKAQTP